MIETDLPEHIQYLLIALQIFALFVFLYFVWPLVKAEKWKEKFIENKTARSILIVFVLVFLFIYGMGAVFDALFPVETAY
jgi:Kef-type K+ transport system membrane component KefB